MSLETSVRAEWREPRGRKQASPAAAHREPGLSLRCLLCCRSLFVWPGTQSRDRDRGRGGSCGGSFQRHSSLSPPHYLQLSPLHLAVNRRNVFKASSFFFSFTGELTTSSCTDVAACIVFYVCVWVCEHFLGHTVCYCSWKLLFTEECVAWSRRLTAERWRSEKWRAGRIKI